MTATYAEATDAMFAQFNTTWQADAASIVGYVPSVFWPGDNEPTEKPSQFWARVSRENVTDIQSTLTDADSSTRYTVSGLLTVQLFAPLNIVGSWSKLMNLAILVQNTFRGTSTINGIWFRRVTVKELPKESKYFRFHVVTQYSYDEVR